MREFREAFIDMQKDLTKGNPFKVIILFALPMLVSMLFQQMYNIADSVVVGKFVGENALAAVGASYPVTMIFLGFATGAGIGCSVIISQAFGARDMKKLKTTICTAMLGILGLCVLITLIGVLSSGALLKLLKTPDNIFADSKTYLDVYIFGLFFLFMYNAATSVFQALGNSRLPLFLLIFSSLFNIALDVIFVYYYRMGVAGVAWATFIAQGISCVVANICLLNQVRKIPGEGFRLFDMTVFRACSVVAIPSILQSTIVSIGQLLVQGLINGYGSTVIAGYSAAIKVNTSIVMILMTVANAVSGYTAQNCGAGDLERIRKGFRVGIVLSYAVAAVCALCVWLWSDSLIGLFIDDGGSAVVEVGKGFMMVLIPGYFLVNLKGVSDSVMRGCGDMLAFMISTLVDLILRVGLSYLLAFVMGSYLGIWWAYPIGWLVGMAVSLVLLKRGKWRSLVLRNRVTDEMSLPVPALAMGAQDMSAPAQAIAMDADIMSTPAQAIAMDVDIVSTPVQGPAMDADVFSGGEELQSGCPGETDGGETVIGRSGAKGAEEDSSEAVGTREGNAPDSSDQHG